MFRTVITLVALACSGSIASAAEEENANELKKLEGTWQLVSAIANGQATPEDVVKKIRVEIKGGKHTVYFDKEVVAKDIPFNVDASKNPRATVDKLPDGKEIKGIYKLDGDTLTSCVAEPGQDRPAEFSSPAGSSHTLRVFKRVKP